MILFNSGPPPPPPPLHPQTKKKRAMNISKKNMNLGSSLEAGILVHINVAVALVFFNPCTPIGNLFKTGKNLVSSNYSI